MKYISFKEKQSFTFSTRLLTWAVSTFEQQISCITRVTGNAVCAQDSTRAGLIPFVNRKIIFVKRGLHVLLLSSDAGVLP